MSRTVVVRYRTTEEHAEENSRLVEAVFAELAAEAPDGLRYITLRLADGVSFVHVALVEGDENPLTRSAAFAEFQRAIAHPCPAPPAAPQATVVGPYPFAGAEGDAARGRLLQELRRRPRARGRAALPRGARLPGGSGSGRGRVACEK